MATSLAEVLDGQRRIRAAYEFKLRKGLKFHNGDPFTAEDVKFSFQRTKGGTAAAEGQGGRHRRSAPRALRAARAVARLHDLSTARSPAAPAGSCPRPNGEGRPRRLQEAPDRARALQVRQQQAGHRARDGGLRGLLAQDAVGQAPRLQEHPGGDHAASRC